MIYKSEDILNKDELYDLQDKLCCSGIPVKYQLTEEELGWAKFIRGKYCIADYIFDNIDANNVLTLNDSAELNEILSGDGINNKAVMLDDSTALQKLFFWLS